MEDQESKKSGTIEDLTKEFQYQRKMGAYTPHFRSKPQDYYESTWCDVVLGFSLMIFIIACFVGISIGLVEWCVQLGTQHFSLTWSIILIIFIIIFLIAAFIGSKNKKKIEAKILKQAIQKQRKSFGKKINPKNDINNHNIKYVNNDVSRVLMQQQSKQQIRFGQIKQL